MKREGGAGGGGQTLEECASLFLTDGSQEDCDKPSEEPWSLVLDVVDGE